MDLNKKLLESAQNGDLESVKECIKNGADIESIDIENYDYTPLMWAVENEHLEIVRFLAQSGANVNADDGISNTALTGASMNGHLAIVKFLIKNCTRVNIKDYTTPLI